MTGALPPPPLTPSEVAAYLGVSIAVVYRLIRAGRLIATRVGGQYRITGAAVHKLLGDEIEI
jgi:excisionase family DNA binding protein